MDNDPTVTDKFIKNSVDKINTFRTARKDEDIEVTIKKGNIEERNSLLCNNYESNDQNDLKNQTTTQRKLKKNQDEDIYVIY